MSECQQCIEDADRRGFHKWRVCSVPIPDGCPQNAEIVMKEMPETD